MSVGQVTTIRPSGARLRWRLTLGQTWAFAAAVLPAVWAVRQPMQSLDLAYLVRSGEIILNTHHLMATDVFTFTEAGHPWLNQQWGTEVLFASIFNAGGWIAIDVARCALVCLVSVFVYLACRAAGAHRKLAAGLTLAAVVVEMPGLEMRAQLPAMALFAASVWILADRHRHPRRLWLLPLFAGVWANLHGSFFLVPVLIGLAFLGDRRRRVPGAAGRLLLPGVASVVAANMNPWGVRIWAYVLSISGDAQITRLVQEWQPPTIRTVAGALFLASALAVAAFLARRGRTTPWPTLLALGGFVTMGLFAVRGAFWWAMVAAPIVAGLRAEDRPAPAGDRPPAAVNTAIVAVIVLLGIAMAPWWRVPVTTSRPGPLVAFAPQGVTAAMQRLVQPGERVFAAQEWGSWFEMAVPQAKVFMDSRIELYSRAVVSQYLGVSAGAAGWQRVLDHWRVQMVVANRSQQSGLIPLILRDPTWRLAYGGPDGLVFVRASG